MIGKCDKCGKYKQLQRHHLFSNTKLNRKLYGKLIDDYRNISYICEDCHMTKPLYKMNEKEFCEAIGAEHKSKTERFKDAR